MSINRVVLVSANGGTEREVYSYEVVEETLDDDITRNGNALDTQIVEASTDEGEIFPYGGVRIVVRVLYQFTRGTA